MNKITILAISAVFAVSMIAITAFEVDAIKPSSDTSENTRLLSSNSIVRVSDDGKLWGSVSGDVLYYGSVLCKIATTPNPDVGIVIHFQHETLVKHNLNCVNNGDADFLILLRDNIDAVFQKGDLLALDRVDAQANLHEVYREQTLP